jgi:flagellin-like hook-associated protein FlgL
MSFDVLSSARISDLYRDTVASSNLDSVQVQLANMEQELSTGKAVTAPSDNPTAAASIEQLQKTITYQTQYTTNLTQGTAQLNEVDSSLGGLSTLLNQAQSIASQNVSNLTSASARASAASVIDSIYNQALSTANTQYNGTYLFGTDNAQNQPYVQTATGLQYNASDTTLNQTFDTGTDLSFQVTGSEAFGGESASVSTGTDISPSLSGTQRIVDLRGANGSGVKLGAIKIGNGTTTTSVDLSNADSVSDVIDDINNAGIAGVTASLTNNGILLNAAPTANITVTDVTGGTTAADLGIATATGGGAGVSVTGADIGAKVTDFTPLSSLRGGLGIDTTGFTITNGGTPKTISLAGLNTVQDLVNAVNSSGTGVSASINSDGTGIDLKNITSGASLSVSEDGGTTATELGFRTFSPSTLLSSLNDGQGVSQPAGNQFAVTTADGSTTNFSLSGAVTVQDAIDQINAQGGGKVTAAFATTGNGIVLTDTTTGTGTLSVTALNAATTASDLGLTGTATGNKITGTDVNGVDAPGLFTDLNALRVALRSNDTNGITQAAEALQNDASTITNLQGTVGARTQELTAQSTSLSAQGIATQSLLSKYQDVDYTTAITQYQALQNSLQASLEVTAKTTQLTLLNYLPT